MWPKIPSSVAIKCQIIVLFDIPKYYKEYPLEVSRLKNALWSFNNPYWNIKYLQKQAPKMFLEILQNS